MKDTIKIFKGDNTYDLHVMWSIHNKCNYACSYCPSELHDGEWQWLNLDRIKGFIDKIENHYIQRLGFNKILFSFTGGEPTLWQDFKPFVEYINSKGFRCGLTTNGSVSPTFWKNISHAFDYICLSFHPEKAEINRFLENYKFLHNDPNTVIPAVRVMMHPSQGLWDKSENLIVGLKKFSNWSYQCVHILKNYGMGSEKIEYHSKEKDEFLFNNAFRDQFSDNKVIKLPKTNFNYKIQDSDGRIDNLNENELINKNQVNFKGWNCHIGIEELFIHFSGSVKTSGCGSGVTIGNILEPEKIRFPTRPTICKDEGCYCPTDIRITKTAPNESLNYEIQDDQSEIKSIGGRNSFFQFRLHLKLDNSTFEKYCLKNYIEHINKYIKVICETHSTVPSHVCVYIEPLNDLNLKSIPNFFKEISKIKSYKALLSSVNEFSNTDIYEISKNFNYVQLKVINLKALSLAIQILKETQNNQDQKLVLNIFKEKINDMQYFQLIKLAMKNNKYYELILHDFEEGDICHYLIKEANTNVLSKINQVEVVTRFNKGNSFVFDEITHYKNGRYSTVIADNFDQQKMSFTGWSCSHGKRFSCVYTDGHLSSSFCSEQFSMGYIENINEDLMNGEIPKCKAKYCENNINQIILKNLE